MSRIHEALKRAEQEKAAGQFTQVAEPSVERFSAPEPAKIVAPPSVIAPPDRFVSPALKDPGQHANAAGFGKFEDLWENCARPHWNFDSDMLVFRDGSAFVSGTEQFRTLRARLSRMRETQKLQTILISSSIPAEGKTVVATNLALAMVRQRGSRVLLVDADLRSPRVHTLLGAPSSPGLAEYLQGNLSEAEVVQRGPQDGFCFVPAGNHAAHPSELLSSDQMRKFLDRMRPLFDWIVIDSPPVLPVADACVLGALSDGVLFVVRSGSTPSEAAQKACHELRDVPMIGVVMNSVNQAQRYGSYYAHSGNPYGGLSLKDSDK